MKKIFYTLISIALFISCNKREDFFSNDESEINIQLSGQDNKWVTSSEFFPVLRDSVKIHKNYALRIENGSEKKVKGIKISKPTFGKLLYQGKEIAYNEYLDLDLSTVLTYQTEKIGLEKIQFTITNIYDKSFEAELHLTVFENAPPKAQLEIIHLSNLDVYEYSFDASGCFDVDERFGGEVVKYMFSVDSVNIPFPTAIMNYTFTGPGIHNISVRCWDNDNAQSDLFTIGNFEVQ